MKLTDVTSLTIIERPSEPAPEEDLRYTVRLRLPGGGRSRVVEGVRTAIVRWPGFLCEPAGKLGEPTHPNGGWEVHWFGQQWKAHIYHAPATFDCAPETPGLDLGSLGASADALRGVTLPDDPEGPPSPEAVTRALAGPAGLEASRVEYSSEYPDVLMTILEERLRLSHPGAEWLRCEVIELDDSAAWGGAVVQTRHRILQSQGEFRELDTNTRFTTAGGITTFAIDVRGIDESEMLLTTVSSTAGKRCKWRMRATGPRR